MKKIVLAGVAIAALALIGCEEAAPPRQPDSEPAAAPADPPPSSPTAPAEQRPPEEPTPPSPPPASPLTQPPTEGQEPPEGQDPPSEPEPASDPPNFGCSKTRTFWYYGGFRTIDNKWAFSTTLPKAMDGEEPIEYSFVSYQGAVVFSASSRFILLNFDNCDGQTCSGRYTAIDSLGRKAVALVVFNASAASRMDKTCR